MTHIAYYRVSTDRQGQSGLGLEAQQQAVAQFLSQPLAAEFVEIESGRNADRPQLAAALAYAKEHQATLIVAKLDRLARDVKMILAIVDSGVRVRFIDLPDVDTSTATGRLILTVMASLAEFEARRIGERTRDALAAKKARGERWQSGNPRAGSRARQELARSHAEGIAGVLAGLDGLTCRDAAKRLTELQIPTPSGGTVWHPGQVSRVRGRL
jgi:DNA invertase Pin-like site-specific DNA recombinase